MKFISTQIVYFLQNRETKRNMQYLFKFLALLIVLITVYSIMFHVIMGWEDKDYSWITGFYWTLTVMSTLGFGDITFVSDAGRLFSIIVLLSGIILLLVMLPFTFIQFFYAPWLDAQTRLRIPKELPLETQGQIIIVGTNPTALNLSEELKRYGYAAIILCPDMQKALELRNMEYPVTAGDHDDLKTYNNLRVEHAAMVVALDNDMRNTSITFTVREASTTVPIVCGADQEDAMDILSLAGSTYVFQFTKLLGFALARRTVAGNIHAGIIGQFGHLMVAEAPVMRTRLVGKTLRSAALRAAVGINVVGVWERGHFHLPNPDTELQPSTVLVLAGSAQQIQFFNNYLHTSETIPAPVLILGGGRVGLAAAEYLETQNIDYRLVEKNPRIKNEKTITGNAADLEILEEAGIRQAPAVLITTHDDDMNTYLTIYCRRLRPDIQIISRATLDRNISILHTAGADLVMSYASLVANTVINLLNPDKILMLSEGLNIFKVPVPTELVGKSLINSGIRNETNCSVVALVVDNEIIANPEPNQILEATHMLVLIGDAASEKNFLEHYRLDLNSPLYPEPTNPSKQLL